MFKTFWSWKRHSLVTDGLFIATLVRMGRTKADRPIGHMVGKPAKSKHRKRLDPY